MSEPQIAALLEQEQERIVAEVVESVWDRLPGYSVDRLDRADLERFVAPHVALVVRLIAERRLPTATEVAQAQELGQSRALQGVPVESVVHSFRVAEHAVLRCVVRAGGGLPRAELDGAVDVLIGVFDSLIAASTSAYRVAQEEVAVHYEQLERDLVADLATGGEERAARAESQARLLGADPDLPHVAVALRPASRDGALRRHLLTALAPATTGRILNGTVGGCGLLLVPADEPTALAAMVRRALRVSPAARASVCGVGTTAGRLSSVRDSCQQALLAAEVAQAGGDTATVVLFDDVLLDVALLSEHGIARRLVETGLRGLVRQGPLLQTLRSYLSHELSQTRTAAELVVHPNTVAYRLDRITEVTGCDVRKPSGAMRLMVALRAFDVLRQADASPTAPARPAPRAAAARDTS